MQTRVITLRFNELIDGFDDTPLREFIKDKVIVSVNEHFFTRLDQPYLAIMVNYKLSPVDSATTGKQAGRSEKRREENWREYVAESDIPLFNALRDWRMERGKRDGLPSYVIFTNRELGAIITAHPTSLGQLGQVAGVGSGKIKSYGADVLAVLGRFEQVHAEIKIADENVSSVGGDEDGSGSR